MASQPLRPLRKAMPLHESNEDVEFSHGEQRVVLAFFCNLGSDFEYVVTYICPFCVCGDVSFNHVDM